MFAVDLAKFLLLLAIWLVVGLGFLAYTKTAIGRYWPTTGVAGRIWPRTVHIGTFADINDNTKDVSAAVIRRAEELTRPVTLDALFEVRVPPIPNSFTVNDELKFLDNTKLTFQGIDVPSVVRAFVDLLPDDDYSITAKSSNMGGDGPVLNLEFRGPRNSSRSWPIRGDFAVGGAASSATIASQVIDRAIYTTWYYMYYDPKGLKRLGDELEANFTSPRALEAYYGGQQRLLSYQRSFQASDLDEAEKAFRLLNSEMPRFMPGWMLLGLTLLEKRNERDAIRAFKRAQELLASPTGVLPPTASESERKNWIQVHLYNAVALLQMYDWKDNHDALRILEAVRADIPKVQDKLKLKDFYEFRKLQFSVEFQIAHIVGHDLTLLDEDNFVKALLDSPNTSSKVPTSLGEPDPKHHKELRDHDGAVRGATVEQIDAARKLRGEDFNREITRVFNKQRDALQEAGNILKEIDALVNAAPAKERLDVEEWKRTRERSVADLQNADGYAQYRYAQRRAANDEEFHKLCTEALAKLSYAQSIRPNEYTIIQNIGLIYSDPRFDPGATELETTRALFARSLEIKSRDFFGYQKLAALTVRQAYQWGLEFLSLDAIKAAIVQAEKARELRPGSGTTFLLLAQLYTLKWSKTATADQAEVASLVEASLALAEGRASRIHFLLAELQWRLVQLRATTKKEEFDDASPKFLAKLSIAKTEAARSEHWDARDLADRATKLFDLAEKLEFEDRGTLRWPK